MDPEGNNTSDVYQSNIKRMYEELRSQGVETDEAFALALQYADEPVGDAMDVDAGPGAISCEQLDEAIRSASSREGAEKLSGMLQIVFSSPSSLLAAFTSPSQTHSSAAVSSGRTGSQGAASSSATSSSTGGNQHRQLDVGAVARFYTALGPRIHQHRSVEDRMAAAQVLISKWLEKGTEDTLQVPQLAAIGILNPILENPDHHNSNGDSRKFFIAVHKLRSEVRQEFTRVLATFPADVFISAIQSLQQYITLTVFSSERATTGVQAAVDVLSLLHTANQAAGGRVAHTHFYNDAINSEEFNLKQDYVRWKATRAGRRDLLGESRSKSSFSFCGYPFLLDPSSKAEIMSVENCSQQFSEFETAVVRAMLSGDQGMYSCPYLVLRVRRAPHLVHDTLIQIHNAKQQDSLKKPLKVKFVGEEGVDEGGVQKEFFQLLLRELFNEDYGMFTYDAATRLHWFRPSPLDLDNEFELVGILIGLAIYNSHLLDLAFPLVLYRQLLGQAVGLEQLHELQPDIAGNLKKLLQYQGDVSEMGLTFQVMTEAGFGDYEAVDLVPNGGEVSVTSANVQQYVSLYVKHILEGSVRRQLGAFMRGFRRMCSGPTLDFFLPEELEQLVCGSRRLDMEALRRAMNYEGGYHAQHQVILWFWDIVLHELTEDQHKRLLSFMTGTERVPIKGLAFLTPPPVISRNGPHSDRLPTAHTCFNHLLLPEYSSRGVLKDRLRLAIENAEGFGLI